MTYLRTIILMIALMTMTACVTGKAGGLSSGANEVPAPPLSAKQSATEILSVVGDPERDFKSALGLFTSGKTEAALLLFRQIAEQRQNTPWRKRSLLMMERALILLDRTSEATEAMLRARAEYQELGDYAVILLAEHVFSKTRYSEAADLFGQIELRYPDSPLAPLALFRKAQALREAKACRAAAEAYKSFIKDYSDSEFAPAAGLDLGKTLICESDVVTAVRAYHDVWVRYPGIQSDQEVEKALAELKTGGAEIPELAPEELYERGRNLFRAGLHEKAAPAFALFLEQRPQSSKRPDAMCRSGISLYHVGKRGEAANMLERMVREYPSDPAASEALFWLGKSYSKLGDWDRGVTTFQKLLERFPESDWCDDALFLIGNIYRETGDMSKSLRFYARLTQEYPDSKYADSSVWWKAWWHYTAGDHAKAENALQELIKRYPRSFLTNQAGYWQGRIAEEKGELSRAVEHYERVLKKGPYTYYGHRASERKARIEETGTDLKTGPAADPMTVGLDACAEEGLSTTVFDDNAPAWTAEIMRLLAAEPSFQRTLELMQLDMKKDAASELWLLQDRFPRKRGMLLGISKAFYELGDYHRSLMLVLRNYERYLEAPDKGATEDLWLLAYPQGFWESITTYARKYGQDPYFVAAVIREESQFHVEALSPAGARGLMQIMPATGEWAAQLINLPGYDRARLFESDTGIQIGTWYISHLMRRFKNDHLLVAAAYNAGPEAVQGWIAKNGYHGERDRFVEMIPYSETRGYVKKVMRNYFEYKRLYGKTASLVVMGLRTAD